VVGKDQIVEIRDRYAKGESSWKIAKDLSIYRTSIIRFVRNGGGAVRPLVKHTCNDSIFSEIDSKEKAYWLGFIAADGYIQNRGAIRVNLGKKDSSHLEKLRLFLGTTSPVRSYRPPSNPYGFSMLEVCSRQIVSDLATFGIVSKKSESLRWPDLDDDLLRHFLRGYFDGDGCIYVSYEGVAHQRYGLCFVSNPQFLTSCSLWISRTLRIPERGLSRAGKSTRAKSLYYQRQDSVQAILKLMYVGSSVHLDRKFNLASILVNGPDYLDRRFTRTQGAA
jgi:hypothetical protein